MDYTFPHLFFVSRQMFPDEKQRLHEEHHKRMSWVYYCTMVLGLWLIASPPTYGYHVPVMIWSDVISGFLLILLSYLSLHPYRLWAQWAIVFLGVWLFIAPMIFWAGEGAGHLTDFLIGTLIVAFGIIIPRQPGIKLFAQPGPNIPPGWSYNPSSWNQRVPVIFLSWVGFFIARYMGAFQMEYIDTIWDPFFGEGTKNVLTSKVSKSFPVSDATLGAFSYILDVLFGYAGGTHRWRTMPWIVIIFGIMIVPLGVVSIILIILQPVSVGFWCTLCLSSALISLIMIPFTVDEVLATVQLMKYEKKVRKRSLWTVFWFGGTIEGGEIEPARDPQTLLPHTFKEITHDFIRRPWNLFITMAIGIWIMASPEVLGYTGSLADNDHVVGALIVTFAVISMSEVTRSVRFISILFGGWLIAAPWIFGAENNTALWSDIIAGILLIPLAFPKGKIEDKRGGFEKYIV